MDVTRHDLFHHTSNKNDEILNMFLLFLVWVEDNKYILT